MTSEYTSNKKNIRREGHGNNGVQFNSEKHPVNYSTRKLSLCQIKHHTMKTYEDVEIKLHACLIASLEGGE
jgi:hypothetical protein